LEGFGFDEPTTPPPKAMPAAYETLKAAERNSLLRIGRNTYRVFKNEGDTLKYAVVHGSKGRKYYQIRVTDPKTYAVGAFEVTSQVEGRTADKPRDSGIPKSKGKVEEDTHKSRGRSKRIRTSRYAKQQRQPSVHRHAPRASLPRAATST
jgi:hypothetical protein